nr:urease accessory UreF family protein [Methylopila sp. M107]
MHPNADPAGPSPSLSEINELALAFAPTREFHLETSQQGRSFLDALLAAWPNGRLTEIARDLDGQVAYPVAVGAAAAAHDVPATEAAAAFLVAIAQALVSAGVRLAPIGQTSGAKIVARIAPLARAIAEQTATLTIDDLANATFRLDLSSARHETQYTRLFRS